MFCLAQAETTLSWNELTGLEGFELTGGKGSSETEPE